MRQRGGSSLGRDGAAERPEKEARGLADLVALGKLSAGDARDLIGMSRDEYFQLIRAVGRDNAISALWRRLRISGVFEILLARGRSKR